MNTSDYFLFSLRECVYIVNCAINSQISYSSVDLILLVLEDRFTLIDISIEKFFKDVVAALLFAYKHHSDLIALFVFLKRLF